MWKSASIAAFRTSRLSSESASTRTRRARGTSCRPRASAASARTSVPTAIRAPRSGQLSTAYAHPAPETAIPATAKWTCAPDDVSHSDDRESWWQRVGTDAHSLEEGLLRFEAYRVAGEDALIIHETFRDTNDLKFHLPKGTAEKYKKDIDKIAAPDCYYFRGPVSWTIRTYSKFLHLPATYSSRGSHFARPGGSMSDGVTHAQD